jgi:hypothetical protein
LLIFGIEVFLVYKYLVADASIWLFFIPMAAAKLRLNNCDLVEN